MHILCCKCQYNSIKIFWKHFHFTAQCCAVSGIATASCLSVSVRPSVCDVDVFWSHTLITYGWLTYDLRSLQTLTPKGRPSIPNFSQNREKWVSRAQSLSKYEYWLPIKYRINFKIATLTYKTLVSGQRGYVCNLLSNPLALFVHRITTY